MALSVPADETRSMESSAHRGYWDASKRRTRSASVSTSSSCIRGCHTDLHSSGRKCSRPSNCRKLRRYTTVHHPRCEHELTGLGEREGRNIISSAVGAERDLPHPICEIALNGCDTRGTA